VIVVSVQALPVQALRARLEDDVEGRLGRAAETSEPTSGDDLSQSLLAGLGAEREPDFLVA